MRLPVKSMLRDLSAGLSLALAATVAMAGNMQVAPLRVQLSAEKSLSSITVKNGGEEEFSVQAEIMEWTQTNGLDNYQPTRDVLVNPVIFKLDPRSTQIVRLGLQVPATDTERSYRIFIQQLPVPASAQPGGARMQTLLRLGIPIFVPPKAPRIGLDWQIVKSHGGRMASLEATNTGNMHVQLTRVVVREPSGRALIDAPTSTYILAGQRAVLPISVPLDDVPSGVMLTIEQSTDAPTPLPNVLLPLRVDLAR